LNINRNDRQINHLISTRTTNNIQSAERNTDMKNTDEVLLSAIQDLIINIPKNSRIIITGITGTNDLRQEFIQETIFEQIMLIRPNYGIILIDEKERLNTAKTIEDIYKSDNVDWDTAPAYGKMVGANIIVTGGVFGNRETRRIVFRAIDVETREVISSSCILFNQNNTTFIDDVEALYQRLYSGIYNNIQNEVIIFVNNNIGLSRNADFILDMIENNLVNNSKYRIITRSKFILDLIQKEIIFQNSGHVSDETSVRIGMALSAQYYINMEILNNKIQIKFIAIEKGNTIIQETI
jgi:hypothetical protein